MFVNTRKEEKIAKTIAAKFGFGDALVWYKRYSVNVLSPWSGERATRECLAAIAAALRAARR